MEVEVFGYIDWSIASWMN